MNGDEAKYLLDRVAERALVGLVAAAGAYLLLSGLIGERWSWIVIRAGALVAIAFGVVSAVWNAVESKAHAFEVRRRELARMDAETERLKIFALESQGSFLHVDVRSGAAQAFFRPVAPHRLTVNHGSLDAPGGIGYDARRPDALTILSAASCALICGGRGAGKTEIVRHIASERIRDGWHVCIIDPKPPQNGKWPGCRVVGCDSDYPAIHAALSGLCGNMRGLPARTLLIIDEMTRLNLRIPDFSDLWLPALLEGREYGVDVWIIGQSKTAGSIGLSGRYDLLECFDAVATAKKDDDRRWIEIETQGKPEPVVTDHPGVFGRGRGCHGPEGGFPGDSPGHDARDNRDNRDDRAPLRIGHDPDAGFYRQWEPERRFYESHAEKTAVELAEKGLSLNAIAKEIWGASNGRRTKRIKQYINRHR